MSAKTFHVTTLFSVFAGLAYILGPDSACADKVFVANYGDSTVEQFTTGGVGSFFTNSGAASPLGMVLDTAGNLYLSNSGTTIEKLTPGGVSSVFASTGLSGAFGLAFDNAGNLYAANNFNNTIEKFTPAGVGSLFANTGLNGPKGLAVDSFGNVYAANSANNTIEKFTPGGVGSLFASTGLHNAYGLAFDSAGNLYAVNAADNNVVKFAAGGGAPTVFASTGLSNPLGLAFDSRDNLYVSSFNANTIRKFTPAGVGSQFASTGLNKPTGIAFLPNPILLNNLLNTSITAIPGGTGNFTGLGSQPAGSTAGAAFVGNGSGGQQGIYTRVAVVSPPNSPIRIADTAMAIPGGNGDFTAFPSSPSISGENVAFVGNGFGGAQGIYAQVAAMSPPQAPPIKVVDTATAIPNGSGNFTGFPSSPSISGQNVAFVGNGFSGAQGVYARVGAMSPPQAPIVVADTATAIPGGVGNFTGFVGSPALSGQNVAFIGSGFGGAQGVYAEVAAMSPPQAPIKVADTATTIPGTADVFQSFESVSMDRSVASAGLAFVGGGTVGGVPMKGVYVSLVGPPNKAADFGTLIPEGTGMFSNFGAVSFDPDAAGNPITVFLGMGSAGQQGIYAQFDGTLRKVVDLGDLLDGKTPVSLSLGTSGLDLGQITFAATFSDGSEGLFTSKLPLALAGDYNGNGVVDAADYTVWRDGLGSKYTQGDYDVWRTHFGETSGGGAGASANAAVPEPATLWLLLAGILTMCFCRRTR